MCKQICWLIFMPIVTMLSMNTWASELPPDHFNGMQLAWVRLPSPSAEGESSSNQKPKATQPAQPAKATQTPPSAPAPVAKPAPAPAAQPAPAPAPTTAPAPVPAPKPVQAPVVQPASVPVVKPEPAPVATPISVPAIKPAPVTKPAPLPVTKIEPVTKQEPSRAHKSRLQPFKWLIGIGMETGGEEIGTVTYSDGSTAPVNANSGIVLNFGSVIANGDDSSFSTQLSVGYKSGGPKIWNADVNWSAIPVEIIEHYHTEYIRMGLGISYQLNPKLKVNLPSSSTIYTYNNAIGYIVQFSLAPIKENYSIDLRYTSIKFQSSDTPNAPVINGSVSGLYANYYF